MNNQFERLAVALTQGAKVWTRQHPGYWTYGALTLRTSYMRGEITVRLVKAGKEVWRYRGPQALEPLAKEMRKHRFNDVANRLTN